MHCDVLVSTLRLAPWSLPWGSSVTAKVIAQNVYGKSLISEAGNGAVIITFADAPKDLQEVVAARTASSITFSWAAGDQNGGASVTSYRVSMNSGSGYAVLE
jgi:hypothetical protein